MDVSQYTFNVKDVSLCVNAHIPDAPRLEDNWHKTFGAGPAIPESGFPSSFVSTMREFTCSHQPLLHFLLEAQDLVTYWLMYTM